MDLQLELKVAKLEQQTLLITVQGEDVLLFEDHAKGKVLNDEVVIPDIVQLFVELTNRGMLSGSTYAPWKSQAEVLQTEVDLPNQRQSWQIRIQSLDPNAFWVLVNLLSARNFSKVTIKTLDTYSESTESTTWLTFNQLKPPSYFQSLPFQLDREEPERTSRNRVVQIVFAQEPEIDFVEIVYKDLEIWTQAVMLGAYPRPGQPSREAGGFPDGVYQLDAFTVEQSFSEIFVSDESAFFAVINYACKLHHTQFPVQAVCVQ